MYKWMTLVVALISALGYSSDKVEGLKRGIEVIEQISHTRDWKDVLPDLSELIEADAESSDTLNHAAGKKEQKTYTGRITRISDGDTVHVTDSHGQKHKIRMAYIDAPETKQAYGIHSRDHLKAMAEDAKVKVKVFEVDRYGREVAQLFKGNIDLNLMQVRDGAAWHYESYAKKQQSRQSFAEYATAQKSAKQHRKGLWHNRHPQAPWDFRKQQHAQQPTGTRWFGW